jgi:hypothetical protein
VRDYAPFLPLLGAVLALMEANDFERAAVTVDLTPAK